MIAKWAGILGIATFLCSLPTQVLAASAIISQEVYTLAKVPSKLQLGSVAADHVNLTISSSNPPGTVIRLYGSNDNQQWTLLKQESDLTTYSDTSVTEDQIRYYKATAVNGDGVETQDSPVLQVLVSNPIDLQGVTLSLVQGEAKFAGLPPLKPTWRYVATLNESGGKLIGTSPRFMRISELEEWITYQLLFNQTYEVVFGIQIGDDDSSRVTKSFELMTDPDPKVEFEKKAQEIVSASTIKMDGAPNSRKVWVEVTVPQSNYLLKVSLDGKEFIGANPYRMDNVSDNTDFVLQFELTDGKHVYKQQVPITTPNRTAPDVTSAYVDQNNVILIVESNSELKQD